MGGLAAVVLAAGAGTRMGAPKALLRLGGRSFVRRAIALAEAAGAAPIVAVAGAVPLPPAELGSARAVVNTDWPKGQMSSLQVGLAAIAGAAPDGVLVLTVDRPHVAPATVVALAEAHRGDPSAIWQPALAGRRGHPILYPGDLIAALRELASDEGPRAWLRSPAIAGRRRELAVDDPAILENIDTPGDLRRLTGDPAIRPAAR